MRVIEVAHLRATPGAEDALEAAVAEATPLFQRASGCRTLQLMRNIEEPDRYELVVTWDSVEDHDPGFRGGPDFGAWRALITPHLAEPPRADHRRVVLTGF